MMNLFRFFEDLGPGNAPKASNLNAICRALNRARGIGGIVLRVKADGGLIVDGSGCGAATGRFSGRVWIHRTGARVAVPAPWKKWIVVTTTGASTTNAEPPSPLPNETAWFETARISGDVHSWL
jgi:hypothetical protein